jgi:hypothetical protein
VCDRNCLYLTSLISYRHLHSNDKHCFDCAYRVTDGFKGKVLLAMGDCRQIPPVVKYGGMVETISASLIHSKYWSMFHVFQFTENLRLTALRSSTITRDVFERETAFARQLLMIGNGTNNDTDAILVTKPLILY